MADFLSDWFGYFFFCPLDDLEVVSLGIATERTTEKEITVQDRQRNLSWATPWNSVLGDQGMFSFAFGALEGFLQRFNVHGWPPFEVSLMASVMVVDQLFPAARSTFQAGMTTLL